MMKDLKTLRPHVRSLLTGMVCAATAVLAPACAGDKAGSNGFFDEKGVWLLTQVQLDPKTEDDTQKPNADDGFLMQFGNDKDGNLVVATAACAAKSDKTKTAHHVLKTECGDKKLDRTWQCNCYGYTFDDKTMVWSELEKKKKKSKKKKKKKDEDDEYVFELAGEDYYDDDDDSGKKKKKKGDGKKKKKKGDSKKKKKKGDDKDEKKDGDLEQELVSTTIKPHKKKKNVYIFTGLPNFDNKDGDEDNQKGVFQSNGVSSKHTFESRTYKKSFKVTGCSEVCGIVVPKEDKKKDDKKKNNKKKKGEKGESKKKKGEKKKGDSKKEKGEKGDSKKKGEKKKDDKKKDDKKKDKE